MKNANDIDILLKYLPIFRSKDFNSIDEECLKKGNTLFIFCYSKEVDNFVKDFYESGLSYSFDWPGWQQEASKYIENPELLKNANLVTVQKLLTLHIRKERFSEGHLISIIDSGHMVAILSRLAQIQLLKE